MVNIRKRFRDWLGIAEIDKRQAEDYRYLKAASDVLYEDYYKHMEKHHAYVKPNGSIEATGYAAYEPEQHGNVVVTEPKLLKVLRKDLG